MGQRFTPRPLRMVASLFLSTPSAPEKYRPDIDGLRAIAVSSVIALPFPASCRAHSSASSFSFADFYARRARRIFPALAARACCDPGGGLVGPSAGRIRFARTTRHCGRRLRREFAAMARIQLFRHRRGAKAAAPPLVTRRGGTVLSGLAAACHSGVSARPTFDRTGDRDGARVLYLERLRGPSRSHRRLLLACDAVLGS